jgi:hypothetical protein
MIPAIIILTIITVAALVFALFCYLHYHLIRKDFEAYQRITENRLKLDDDRYGYLCDLANDLKKQNTAELEKSILIALLSNPERYKYISELVRSGSITQEEANIKNIHKAYKIAQTFKNYGKETI